MLPFQVKIGQVNAVVKNEWLNELLAKAGCWVLNPLLEPFMKLASHCSKTMVH